MEQELKIFIINLDKKQIRNEKTGEVTDWCMVTYLVPKEETSKSKGVAELSCYCQPIAWDELDKHMFKWVNAKMTQTVEKNRIKLKIKSINNVVVS